MDRAAVDSGANAWSTATFYGNPGTPDANLKLIGAFFEKVSLLSQSLFPFHLPPSPSIIPAHSDSLTASTPNTRTKSSLSSKAVPPT
jgi:hypothetical protein